MALIADSIACLFRPHSHLVLTMPTASDSFGCAEGCLIAPAIINALFAVADRPCLTKRVIHQHCIETATMQTNKVTRT